MAAPAFAAYCAQVVAHVRCRFVRASIAAELAAHLEDHADALIEQGHTPDEAVRCAVAAMGDAEEVGRGLDALYPPVLYWLVRILALCAATAALLLLLSAATRTGENRWYTQALFPDSTPVETLDGMVRGGVWNQRVIATGSVTGGGALGDYTFAPLTGAQLVYSPAFVWDGVPMESYYSLQFILGARHLQPWLGGVELAWAHPTMADGAGNRVSTFASGPDALAIQVDAYPVSLLRDYIAVYLLPLDPAQERYTFSFTGADGRTLSFEISLTDWEVSP